MDIYSKSSGAAGALSNFFPYDFSFDGVACASMEGLLQSLLTDDPKIQRHVCQMIGLEAKEWGTRRCADLGETQRLWWKGQEYDRYSASYQELLDRMFEALFENPNFCAALLFSGDEPLTHSIGHPDPKDTILTQKEFCLRLMTLRKKLLDALG